MVAYTLVLVEFLYRFIFKRPTTREIDLVGWIPGCGRCCGGRKEAKVIPTSPDAEKTGSLNSTDIENGKSHPHHAHAGATGARPVKVKVLLAACAFSTLLIFIR